MIWELRDGPSGSSHCSKAVTTCRRAFCGSRLTELEEAGLVQRTNGTGYVLTAIGHKLRAASLPLTNWLALR